MQHEVKMDAVDAEQHRQIIDLQKKDVAHDRDLLWVKVSTGLVWTWSIIAMVIILYGMEIVNRALKLIEAAQK